jgi:hypothetical protein
MRPYMTIGLDDGHACQSAAGTVHAIANRKWLPQLADDPDEQAR